MIPAIVGFVIVFLLSLIISDNLYGDIVGIFSVTVVFGFILGIVLFIPSCAVTNLTVDTVDDYDKKAKLVSLSDHVGTGGTFLTVSSKGDYFGYVKTGKDSYELEKFDSDKYTIVEKSNVKPHILHKDELFKNPTAYYFGFPADMTDRYLVVPKNSIKHNFKLDAQ